MKNIDYLESFIPLIPISANDSVFIMAPKYYLYFSVITSDRQVPGNPALFNRIRKKQYCFSTLTMKLFATLSNTSELQTLDIDAKP